MTMMWGYSDGMGWGGWLMMVVVFLLFWGGLIAVAVWLLHTYRTGPGDTARTSGRADDVLAERYARGEIDDAEYARMRETLRASKA